MVNRITTFRPNCFTSVPFRPNCFIPVPFRPNYFIPVPLPFLHVSCFWTISLLALKQTTTISHKEIPQLLSSSRELERSSSWPKKQATAQSIPHLSPGSITKANVSSVAHDRTIPTQISRCTYQLFPLRQTYISITANDPVVPHSKH
jgi:hypothetical protein